MNFIELNINFQIFHEGCEETHETLKYNSMYFSVLLVFYLKYYYDAYLAPNNLYDVKRALSDVQRSTCPIEGKPYYQIRYRRVDNYSLMKSA